MTGQERVEELEAQLASLQEGGGPSDGGELAQLKSQVGRLQEELQVRLTECKV